MHCAGGADCADDDPLVSSLAPEVCANTVDDDCDGATDEDDCTAPAYDDCASALVVSGPGNYALSTDAAAGVSAGCGAASALGGAPMDSSAEGASSRRSGRSLSW